MSGMGFWKHGGYGGTGFLHKKYTGTSRPSIVCDPGMVDCPERKEKVHSRDCVECEKFQVWHEKDEDFKRCFHEFKDLESRGHYDGTWNDHPENFDPETFRRIQEEKRLNEEVNREMELERQELRSQAEELMKKIPDDYFMKYCPEGEYDSELMEEEPADQFEEDEEEWL